MDAVATADLPSLSIPLGNRVSGNDLWTKLRLIGPISKSREVFQPARHSHDKPVVSEDLTVVNPAAVRGKRSSCTTTSVSRKVFTTHSTTYVVCARTSFVSSISISQTRISNRDDYDQHGLLWRFSVLIAPDR